MATERMQHCDYCGAELGIYKRHYGEIETCGAPECERYALDQAVAERDEAHHQLDVERGWDRF